MEDVWAGQEAITCVHPGWPVAVGWDEVRATWLTILRNTAEIHFTVEDERIEVRGDLAWVVCVERLASRAGGSGSEGEVLATNVFRREEGRWRLVHHHGSPNVPRPAAAPAKAPRRTLN